MKTLRLIAVMVGLLGLGQWIAPVTYGGEPTDSQTVTLAVENMTCAMCPFTVRKSLENVQGVIDAKVDFATGTATVVFDPAVTTVAALTTATTNAGYPSALK